MEQEKFCKKLTYKVDTRKTVLYGLVEKEDNLFLTFRTNRKVYRVSKICILALEPTTRVFVSEIHSKTKFGDVSR